MFERSETNNVMCRIGNVISIIWDLRFRKESSFSRKIHTLIHEMGRIIDIYALLELHVFLNSFADSLFSAIWWKTM